MKKLSLVVSKGQTEEATMVSFTSVLMVYQGRVTVHQHGALFIVPQRSS